MNGARLKRCLLLSEDDLSMSCIPLFCGFF